MTCNLWNGSKNGNKQKRGQRGCCLLLENLGAPIWPIPTPFHSFLTILSIPKTIEIGPVKYWNLNPPPPPHHRLITTLQYNTRLLTITLQLITSLHYLFLTLYSPIKYVTELNKKKRSINISSQ